MTQLTTQITMKYIKIKTLTTQNKYNIIPHHNIMTLNLTTHKKDIQAYINIENTTLQQVMPEAIVKVCSIYKPG